MMKLSAPRLLLHVEGGVVLIAACIIYLVHTYAASFILFLVAYFAHMPGLFAICTIWVAHIGFDRLLGYGLKYPTAFKDTHIGRL